MTLYEINKSIEDAFEKCIDLETGEIIDDTKILDDLAEARDVKIENIALMIKNLNAEATAIKEEKQKLAARQKTAENRAEWLKNYLVRNMEPGEAFKTARASISWRRSESVNVNSVLDLPEAYLIKRVEPDKTAIRTALKAGIEVKGAQLVENQNIQIR